MKAEQKSLSTEGGGGLKSGAVLWKQNKDKGEQRYRQHRMRALPCWDKRGLFRDAALSIRIVLTLVYA